jgi:hypothetical protein
VYVPDGIYAFTVVPYMADVPCGSEIHGEKVFFEAGRLTDPPPLDSDIVLPEIDKDCISLVLLRSPAFSIVA